MELICRSLVDHDLSMAGVCICEGRPAFAFKGPGNHECSTPSKVVVPERKEEEVVLQFILEVIGKVF